jgi:peptide/nickel transport system ATP-binding protein
MRNAGIIQPLLEVKNLRAWLPTDRGLVKVVDGVSFALPPGRTLGIVGESGCGKSMLARAIMGLLPLRSTISPKSSVTFNGRNLIGMPQNRIRRIIGRDIAMIFQDPMTSLNPLMKVGRQIAEVLCCHLKTDRQTAQQRAVALLDLVGIPMAKHRADQYPHHLSGGLRQRVAIAIALACEPRILIADEPTTALDVTVQADILDLLSRLQEEKQMAMILITHDLGIVAGRTHDIAVMYGGRIVEQAPTVLLFNEMAMPYTRALMDAIPRLENPPHTELRAIGGQPPDLMDLPPGCRFAPRCCYSKDRCLNQDPELKRINGKDHRVACWYPLRIT